MFDSIVLIQFKNKKQNKKLEFEVQHLMIFTYFFLWITFLMKSEKITLKSDMHYVLFWQTLNNLRHRSYFGYPCYFELFPNDALSVDYSRPRQKSARFLHYINSHVIDANRYVLPHLRTKQNTNMGMVQSLCKYIS